MKGQDRQRTLKRRMGEFEGIEMATFSVEVPDDVDLCALRLEVALQLYVSGAFSQGAAAEISGLGRREFMMALGKRGIPFTNITPEDLREELSLWRK